MSTPEAGREVRLGRERNREGERETIEVDGEKYSLV